MRELIAGAFGSPRTIWERLIFKCLSDKLAALPEALKPCGKGEQHSFSLDKSGKR
jgi:hypothetical protein